MKHFSFIFFFLNLCVFQSFAQPSSDNKFFPIAVWLQNPVYAKQYNQDGAINMYIGLWHPLDEKQYDLLKQAGVKLICEQNSFGLAHANEPLIYGWMHGDEPDNAQWNDDTKTYDPCISPQDIIAYYKEVKQKDPLHPYYLNLGQGVSYTTWIGRGECTGRTDMYAEYLKGCDIASFDIYPVNSADTAVRDKLWMGAKGIDSLRNWCNDNKPIWTWIETTQIGKDSPGKPTPQEVKSQVWMAIIHGAKGIGYFCHSFYPENDDAALLHDKEMLAGIKEINIRINALAPVLNSKTISDFAAVTSNNPKVKVDMMAKKYNNSHYLFAAAMRNEKTIADYQVSSGNEVEVIGEDRKIKIVNGRFEDHFNGYEIHIYKIK